MAQDEDEKARLQAILNSPSYRVAHKDPAFLDRDELRPSRLQLELLKARMALDENKVRSTIVVFGSTRIVSPEEAKKRLQAARERAQAAPDQAEAQRQVRIAQRIVAKSKYYQEARRFAQIVSSACQIDGQCDFFIVTGGGPGIMEAANRGAYEVGAKSIGLNITLPFEQVPNSYITPDLCFQFHYFALRKMHFLIRAKALVVFPGGFGTLDELFESLTLVQTHKMAPFPILLFGREYWRNVLNFDYLVEEGTISPQDVHLFRFVETAEEAWNIVSEARLK
ncbi:MAG: TIGR00730 family Rossman fold protein [Acidobacteriota bacterium]